ncbi:MAG: DUF5357 family protein, partial [Cyanobacteria bacterium P01_A01_bin.37]
MNSLLTLLNALARRLIDVFWPKQAFSWQTVFWLSFFSWVMALLSVDTLDLEFLQRGNEVTENSRPTSDSLVGATRVLFTMAWVFLTVAVGWFLANQKLKIPILAITLKPAIWATSALTSIFLFEAWNSTTLPFVFMSWPIVFALYASIPKVFLISSGRFAMPQPAVRQQIVLTTLICLVLSCLLRFHFTLQSWIDEEYPALQLIDFSANNNLMLQVRAPRPVLRIADQVLQEEVGTLTIPEVRRWLVRPYESIPALNVQFQEKLKDAREPDVWELDIIPEKVSDPEFVLHIMPTHVDNRIGLKRICRVVSSSSLSAEEIEGQAQVFDDLPADDETTPFSAQAQQSDGSDNEDETAESPSLAAQAWEQISDALGISSPSGQEDGLET